MTSNARSFTQKILGQYHVGSEDELLALLVKESETIPCVYCHKEMPIEQLSFDTGDPVCENCRQYK